VRSLRVELVFKKEIAGHLIYDKDCDIEIKEVWYEYDKGMADRIAFTDTKGVNHIYYFCHILTMRIVEGE